MDEPRKKPLQHPPSKVSVQVRYEYRDGTSETLTLTGMSMINIIVLVRDVMNSDLYCEGAHISLKWKGTDTIIRINRDV